MLNPKLQTRFTTTSLMNGRITKAFTILGIVIRTTKTGTNLKAKIKAAATTTSSNQPLNAKSLPDLVTRGRYSFRPMLSHPLQQRQLQLLLCLHRPLRLIALLNIYAKFKD